MPTLDLTDGRLAPLKLWSVMLHPTDERHRSRFIQLALSAAADELAYSAEAKVFEPEDRLRLHELGFQGRFFEAAANDACKKMTVRTGKFHPGRVAGQLLFIPMIVSIKYCRDDIGKIKATSLLSDSERNIQTIWSKYAPCAHLWAAWELAGFADELLPLAASIGAWASSFYPRRSAVPLLDVPYWRVLPGEDLGVGFLKEAVSDLNFSREWREKLHLDQ